MNTEYTNKIFPGLCLTNKNMSRWCSPIQTKIESFVSISSKSVHYVLRNVTTEQTNISTAKPEIFHASIIIIFNLMHGIAGDSFFYNLIFHGEQPETKKATCYSIHQIDPLHKCVNGHRSKFYYVVRHSRMADGDCDDEQVVGAHLVHFHNLKSKDDFTSSYRIFYFSSC